MNPNDNQNEQGFSSGGEFNPYENSNYTQGNQQGSHDINAPIFQSMNMSYSQGYPSQNELNSQQNLPPYAQQSLSQYTQQNQLPFQPYQQPYPSFPQQNQYAQQGFPQNQYEYSQPQFMQPQYPQYAQPMMPPQAVSQPQLVPTIPVSQPQLVPTIPVSQPQLVPTIPVSQPQLVPTIPVAQPTIVQPPPRTIIIEKKVPVVQTIIKEKPVNISTKPIAPIRPHHSVFPRNNHGFNHNHQKFGHHHGGHCSIF